MIAVGREHQFAPPLCNVVIGGIPAVRLCLVDAVRIEISLPAQRPCSLIRQPHLAQAFESGRFGVFLVTAQTRDERRRRGSEAASSPTVSVLRTP